MNTTTYCCDITEAQQWLSSYDQAVEALEGELAARNKAVTSYADRRHLMKALTEVADNIRELNNFEDDQIQAAETDNHVDWDTVEIAMKNMIEAAGPNENLTLPGLPPVSKPRLTFDVLRGTNIDESTIHFIDADAEEGGGDQEDSTTCESLTGLISELMRLDAEGHTVRFVEFGEFHACHLTNVELEA